MFEKAIKSKSKLRLAITSPSGGGKTYTALSIAEGIGGTCALIDTEHGSASLYADRFKFDVCELQLPFSIESYIKAIKDAGSIGYNVLIIDSLSHAWDYLLEQVDKLANAKFNGNSFRAWSEGTPEQRKFIEAIVSYPGHIIATMRVVTDYVVEANDKGGMMPRKVGLKPRQREGLEYEFSVLLEGTTEHYFTVTKDRTGKFQDKIIEKPSAEFGRELVDWLNQGEEVKKSIPVEAITDNSKILLDIKAKIKELGLPEADVKNQIKISNGGELVKFESLSVGKATEIYDKLKEYKLKLEANNAGNK